MAEETYVSNAPRESNRGKIKRAWARSNRQPTTARNLKAAGREMSQKGYRSFQVRSEKGPDTSLKSLKGK